jgi:hypothetical protein
VNTDKPYASPEVAVSEQGRGEQRQSESGNVQMRILIELQVISILLMQSGAPRPKTSDSCAKT